ncbi:MAG TPA: hypothetical protein VF342_06300 [Alphaproteobacteria bacterium]
MRTLIVPVLAAAALAACAESPPYLSAADESFGNAVRHNMALQVVNPDPQPDPGPIALEGDRALIALERYRTDQVKQPRPLRTTTINIFAGSGK